MQKITSFIILLFASCNLFGFDGKLWHPVHSNTVTSSGKRNFIPDRYETFYFNIAEIKKKLFALKEGYTNHALIALPAPEGSRQFRIWQSGIMEPGLVKKYPEIKTFTAEATDNSQVTAKIDLSPSGFHAMVYDGDHTYFIDPYSDIEDGYYICYYKKDCKPQNNMPCLVKDEPGFIPHPGNKPDAAQKTHGTEKRNYRLALACTYQYAQAVAGPSPTKASVLAQMVLIVNRVNGVYERELASTMTLVDNTDTLIYLTPFQPYLNDNGYLMLDQNIANIDSLIGFTNYDIGHVFSTGGGGVAFLASICTDGKAGGVTGLNNPVGDPFAIDYVAHEMGHQFGSGLHLTPSWVPAREMANLLWPMSPEAVPLLWPMPEFAARIIFKIIVTLIFIQRV